MRARNYEASCVALSLFHLGFQQIYSAFMADACMHAHFMHGAVVVYITMYNDAIRWFNSYLSRHINRMRKFKVDVVDV